MCELDKGDETAVVSIHRDHSSRYISLFDLQRIPSGKGVVVESRYGQYLQR